ncbi:hypothetical protein OBBRIDRAFT_859473, partial [Obba rivulosa]
TKWGVLVPGWWRHPHSWRRGISHLPRTLSQHSVVFKDMFTIPQPEVAEKMEGYPVVRLSESSEDLHHVLRLLSATCNPKNPSRFPPSRPSFEMRTLRDQALNELKEVFTDDYPDFIDLDEYLEMAPFKIYARDAITVVNLARVTETPSMLRPALYMYCQLDEELVVGFEKDSRCEIRQDPASRSEKLDLLSAGTPREALLKLDAILGSKSRLESNVTIDTESTQNRRSDRP